MSKVNRLYIKALVGMLIITPAYAQDNQQQSSAVQAQAINNYKQLSAPPDVTKAADEWLIYFGPTKEEAAKNKTAEAKRKYVEQHSPLKTIPNKRVERPTKWLTLTAEQPVAKRSQNNTVTSDTPTNSYGY